MFQNKTNVFTAHVFSANVYLFWACVIYKYFHMKNINMRASKVTVEDPFDSLRIAMDFSNKLDFENIH